MIEMTTWKLRIREEEKKPLMTDATLLGNDHVDSRCRRSAHGTPRAPREHIVESDPHSGHVRTSTGTAMSVGGMNDRSILV